MTEKCMKLRKQHIDKFGYSFMPSLEVLKEEPNACAEYCDLIERSLRDNVDYIIGHYGVTEEYVKQQKHYDPTEIIYD